MIWHRLDEAIRAVVAYSYIPILVLGGLLVATAALGQIAGTGTNTGPPFNKWDRTGMGIINNFTTSASPPLTGALLLEDNSSIVLLEDNSSQFCLEGGC